eukprot:SAG31_NODE_251_length_19069_cov_5.843226_12_plen_138_part_00
MGSHPRCSHRGLAFGCRPPAKDTLFVCEQAGENTIITNFRTTYTKPNKVAFTGNEPNRTFFNGTKFTGSTKFSRFMFFRAWRHAWRIFFKNMHAHAACRYGPYDPISKFSYLAGPPARRYLPLELVPAAAAPPCRPP